MTRITVCFEQNILEHINIARTLLGDSGITHLKFVFESDVINNEFYLLFLTHNENIEG